MKTTVLLSICFSVLLCSCKPGNDRVMTISAPADSLYTVIDKRGTSVIPNGRLLTPMGNTIQVAPHPFGLAMSDDGDIAVTANSGVSPLSISIVKGLLNDPRVQQVPPGPSTNKGILASVFMGLALSPDRSMVYVAGGQENKIYLFGLSNGSKIDSIDCSVSTDGSLFPDGYIGDMVLAPSGEYLYAVDQTNFRMMIVDVHRRRVVRSVPMGRYPFGIATSPDGKKVYVANVGMFEYKKIGTIEETEGHANGLEFPPFGYGTREMKEGVRIDSLDVPGLGDPNVPESFSVWVVSVTDPLNPKVTSKIKTGVFVGEEVEGIPAVGGSSPNSLVATSRYVFVSNGNNDNISVIDIGNDKIVEEIPLQPHEAVKYFRGVIPFGLAVSPDEKRLYVAEAGLNAVGIVDVETFQVIGHLPVGWFPSKLRVTRDGKTLVVANAKGYGSGPNGGKGYRAGPEGTYIGSLMKGTLSVIAIPSDDELPRLTERVLSNNFKIRPVADVQRERGKNPIPVYGGERESPIKHLVFVSKENRTYDEVFGQMANADGDASLARYGHSVTFSNRNKSKTVKDATVMPNHLKLAAQFAFSDNFYVDSDVSADGHRWLVNTYPNEWVETSAPASYGGNRSYRSTLKAPGSLAMTSSAGAIYPEDYNEAGSLWEHLDRNGIDFFNFGFGTMFEPAFYNETFKKAGVRHFVNYPVPAPMFDRTSRIYPTYNTALPDQFRINQFIAEFNEKWGDGGMPQMLTIIVPQDHGAGERPDAGYPFRESYMADNDLAVGRLVEFLSHTKYWKEMAIVITEDDAQNGVDHIDAHRSILMVVSPYVKRGYVSSVHYSFGSLFKTFWNVLGLPYLNQYDAGATDLSDMFTDKPDFTPYSALPSDLRIFDPVKALTPLDEKFDWNAIRESPDMDDPEDMLKDQKERKEYRIEDQKKEKQ